MTIVCCPKCDEPVRMPPGAGPRATVQCPLCLERFPLAQIVAGLPPTLEVVEDPDADAEFALAQPLGTAQLAAPADEWSAEPVETGTPAAFSFDRASSEAARTSTAAAPHRHRPRSRSQRKPKNPAWEIAKIALGGIAGLLIAQLLLWWMPWQHLRRDPFSLGPSVAQYAPWLVPQTFHGRPPAAVLPASPSVAPGGDGTAASGSADFPRDLPQRSFDDPMAGNTPGNVGGGRPADLDDFDPLSPAAGARPSTARDQGVSAGWLGGTGPARADSTPAGASADTPPSALPDESSVLPGDETGETPSGLDGGLSGFEPMAGDDAAAETDPEATEPVPPETTAADPIASPLPADPPADAPGTTESPQGADPPVAADDPGKVEPPGAGSDAGAADTGAAEFASALTAARAAAEVWHAASPAETRAVLASSFRAFARLAEALSWVRQAAQEDRLAGLQLLRSLSDDKDKLLNLGRAGAAWLSVPDRRDSSGVLLVGRVAETSRRGKLYRTELELPDGSKAAVYSDSDPLAVYGADDQVLIAGTIIDQPAQKLAGFEGSEQTVVWEALAQVIPE